MEAAVAGIGARHRVIFVGGCIAAALTMAGCTDAEPADVTPTPSTTAATSTTAHGPDHAPTPTPPGTALPTPPATGTADRPADLETVVQGQSYWAVYLVVAPPGNARLDTAFQELQSAGYHPSLGELGCDHGAAGQLTPTPRADAHAVRVFFSTESDAQQFAAGTSPAPVGTVLVQTFCVD